MVPVSAAAVTALPAADAVWTHLRGELSYPARYSMPLDAAWAYGW
jgi:hypothetical protein